MPSPATPPPPPVAVLLAAGRGSRMNSRYPTAAHRILGKPVAWYPVDLCRRMGLTQVIVVVGDHAEAVRAVLGTELEYVEQPEPRGDADALRTAVSRLHGYEGPLLVIHTGAVLLTEEEIAALLQPIADGSAAGVLGTDDEEAAAFAFNSRKLLPVLPHLAPEEDSGEFSLAGLVRLLEEKGERVDRVDAEDATATLAIRDRMDLADATGVLRDRILARHMLSGVTVEDPLTTYIDPEVRIGRDTTIRPLTHLHGATVIGEECEIGPSVRILDSAIGEGAKIQFAVLTDSEVGPETTVGPFAQLRPGSKTGRKVKIGNFVELKNSTAEDRASIGHFAYIGDAFVGEHSNIGAGTITCNYDGRHKHRTHIGKDTFIGTHTTLVAPVTVEDGAFVAAATVVTEDVPADALAIGRSRQTNREGWARRRREAQQ